MATLSRQSRLNSRAGKPGYTLKMARCHELVATVQSHLTNVTADATPPLTGRQLYAQRDPLKESTCSHFVSHLQYSFSQWASLA